MSKDSDKLKSMSKKELEQKVIELESEIKNNNKTKSHRIKKTLRSISVWILVFICALSINLSVAAGWLKQNIVNTQVWTSKTSQILQDNNVQKDLANQITNQIFESTNAEATIQEFVPPRASALTGPLTQSLKSFTNEQVIKILDSEKFQKFWEQVNTSAHEGIIASLENGGKKPEGNYVVYIDNDKLLLNLNPIVKNIQTQLSAAGLNFADKLNTDRVQKTITLTEINSLPTVLYYFNVLNKLAKLLFILAIISGAAAIYLSVKKRKTIIGISAATAILMALNVQAIFFARAPLINQVNSSLQASSSASASAIFDILTANLIAYNRAVVAIAIIIFITAVMTGPAKFAVFIRQKIANLSNRKNNKFIKNLEENAVTYVSILAITYIILILLGLVKNITATLVVLVIFSLISFWLLSIRKSK